MLYLEDLLKAAFIFLIAGSVMYWFGKETAMTVFYSCSVTISTIGLLVK